MLLGNVLKIVYMPKLNSKVGGYGPARSVPVRRYSYLPYICLIIQSLTLQLARYLLCLCGRDGEGDGERERVSEGARQNVSCNLTPGISRVLTL